MTSRDGIAWTARTAPDGDWGAVAYGNGLFVAVSDAPTPTPYRVITSPDGITWTARTAAADNAWNALIYAGGQFVAVAASGTGNRVMTSPDGITWTSRSSSSDVLWRSITYANGLYVAVGGQPPTFGDRVMTSGVLFPATPAAPTAVAGDALETVTVGPGSTPGGAADTFTVTASPGGATCTVAGAAGGPCTFDGLTNGTAYTFTATATNATGTSPASAASAAVTPAAVVPTAPALPGRTRCTRTTCITVGTVPTGVTRITQAASRRRAATSVAHPFAWHHATATRGACRIITARGSRTYVCTTRLARGNWTLTTRGLSSTNQIVAQSMKRVHLAGITRPAVTG